MWIHALEVVDAALAFRAGMELPRGRGTEDRKRLAHRWTVGVFLAALLHDLGKPMADMRVSLFGDLVHDAHRWAALAGPMTSAGAFTHYSVDFVDGSEKDYQLHQKLPAILMQRFVPETVLRWLADDAELLNELLQYLSGDNKEGILAEIVKRADSESVRRNLLSGPRTRFASARARPLIERLMEALRRILEEGSALPLNRAGAAGWVCDDALWIVCGRLADELRTYLAANESLNGIPGKDKNDRIFDCFQEYGGAETNPSTQGAVWRVLVECEDWKSPGVLTVLKFPLGLLFADHAKPRPMNGKITVVAQKDKAEAAKPAASPPAAPPAAAQTITKSDARKEPVLAPEPAARTVPAATGKAVIAPVSADTASPPTPPAKASNTGPASSPPPLQDAPPPWIGETLDAVPPLGDHHLSAPEVASRSVPVTAPAAAIQLPAEPVTADDSTTATASDDSAEPEDSLDVAEAAPASLTALLAESEPKRSEASTDLIAPVKPMDQPRTEAKPRKDGTPAAKAFMRWVQLGVNSGELKYNETQALVHFVPEGCLLLSPEIFKRFVREHQEVDEGDVAALIKQYGDRAYTRLQNEFAKSPWTVRNGDENLHYYAFTKHAGGISPTSSFYLLGKPDLFWRPVPEPNHRIVKTERPPRKLKPKEHIQTQ
ncbi:hypothetical protein JY96_21490 [Aquabacterium sp. NJ1]|nr:hypothetical protein JY96_21490 [Aquabacterium sp. NJ1]